MIRHYSLILCIAAVTLTGCQNQKTVSSSNEVKQNDSARPTLQTHLRTIGNNFSTDSVQLSFTVINHADTVQHFCKWETPFEPFLGKYMEVLDEEGNEALFTGPMARRIMPPPIDSFIHVQPHDSVSTIYNLAKNYTIKPGKYTVKYTGGGVSGLDKGNEIKIAITGK